MSMFLNRFPDTVNVSGKEYKINTDFRIWIEFERLMIVGDCTHETIIKVLAMCYVDILPPSASLSMMALAEFYSQTNTSTDKDREHTRKKPIYDFEQDGEYIYSAFFAQYGIDLEFADLHWWKFRSLFKGLNDTNLIVKIMEYRSVDLSKIKDKHEKAYYRKMKNVYALADNRTQEQKEMDLARELGGLF